MSQCAGHFKLCFYQARVGILCQQCSCVVWGLLTAWNPLAVRCKAYLTVVGILIEAKFRGVAGCGTASIFMLLILKGLYFGTG